jgi:hypothetical protein
MRKTALAGLRVLSPVMSMRSSYVMMPAMTEQVYVRSFVGNHRAALICDRGCFPSVVQLRNCWKRSSAAVLS